MKNKVNSAITFTLFVMCSAVCAQKPSDVEYQPSPSLQEVLDGKHSPEEFHLGPGDAPLTKLEKEQVNALFAERKILDYGFETAQIQLATVLDCERRLCEALVNYYAGQPERQIEAMKRRLNVAIQIEKLTSKFAEFGNGPVGDSYRAAADRLGVEIDLMRLKEKLATNAPFK